QEGVIREKLKDFDFDASRHPPFHCDYTIAYTTLDLLPLKFTTLDLLPFDLL
ncbi:7807_t:CDS:1, partial [Gigaspora rosea]